MKTKARKQNEKKLVETVASEVRRLSGKGKTWGLKCPGCSGRFFVARVEQWASHSSFVMLRLVCSNCGDGLFLEQGPVPHDSAWGRKMQLTLDDEIRDRTTYTNTWLQRVIERHPAYRKVLQKLGPENLRQFKREVLGLP